LLRSSWKLKSYVEVGLSRLRNEKCRYRNSPQKRSQFAKNRKAVIFRARLIRLGSIGIMNSTKTCPRIATCRLCLLCASKSVVCSPAFTSVFQLLPVQGTLPGTTLLCPAFVLSFPAVPPGNFLRSSSRTVLSF
jgi:hypothetical protein